MKYYVQCLLLCMFLYACNSKPEEIEYQSYLSQSKSYVVDIPTDVALHESTSEFMSFVSKKTNLIIVIQLMNKSLEEYSTQINNFSYKVIEESDSTLFYRVTRGSTAMWCATELYRKKTLNGEDYVISVSSDKLSSQILKQMISHIASSMSKNGDVKNRTNKVASTLTKWNKYSSPSLSISYPSDWQVRNNPDQISDVYIGSKKEALGFTVLHFDTDYELKEIVDEGISNMSQAGWKVISNKKITLSGLEGYKTIYSHKIQGADIKQICYSTKKGTTFYNFRFGNSPISIDKNTDDIESIVKSIIIK